MKGNKFLCDLRDRRRNKRKNAGGRSFNSMPRPVGEWLEGVRKGLGQYDKVLIEDGADDEESLSLYTVEDEPALLDSLEAAGCPRLSP